MYSGTPLELVQQPCRLSFKGGRACYIVGVDLWLHMNVAVRFADDWKLAVLAGVSGRGPGPRLCAVTSPPAKRAGEFARAVKM